MATDPLRDAAPENPVIPDAERYRVYRLCECPECGGAGKTLDDGIRTSLRCPDCRGEGRVLSLLATAGTPEAVGTALVTLGREGEFEGCDCGILDTTGETGEKWLLRPWRASPRNVSDAGRVLRSARS